MTTTEYHAILLKWRAKKGSLHRDTVVVNGIRYYKTSHLYEGPYTGTGKFLYMVTPNIPLYYV